MQILLWSIAFVASLAVLVKAADYFTGYSETVGKILGIPQFIIGVSIVALGTSLPELITSIIATTNDYSSIVAANVVGSNIANTLFGNWSCSYLFKSHCCRKKTLSNLICQF